MAYHIHYQTRQDMKKQLENVDNLKLALWAFRQIDTSLTITLGPDWLTKANKGNIIADIGNIMAGFLIPDANGKLISTLREAK